MISRPNRRAIPLGGYEPHDHATALGIQVIYGKPRTANGLWLPDHNTIILKRGMRSLHERSVLAHEIGHAALGHRESTPRNERQADRFAARNLVSADRLARVAAGDTDPAQWCYDLGVMPYILTAYFDHLRAA